MLLTMLLLSRVPDQRLINNGRNLSNDLGALKTHSKEKDVLTNQETNFLKHLSKVLPWSNGNQKVEDS